MSNGEEIKGGCLREAPDLEWEFLSEDSLKHLNYQQKILYHEFWTNFLKFVRERGKDPDRHVGYHDTNVRPIARRVHQVFNHFWEQDKVTLEITPTLATEFLNRLDKAEVTTNAGKEYTEASKRKFKDVMRVYFRFQGEEWNPGIEFNDDEPSFDSDPFTRREREQLLNAALDYKSPPSYSNVSPEERDRWNAQIAQYLGIPKDEVSPSDWQELTQSWKIPSIISTSLDNGWRAKMVGELETGHVDLDNEQIVIPADVSVKNDRKWTAQLSTRSARILKRWLEQRSNKVKYDDSRALWLNREGNRYDSRNLNDLLRNLMEEAGIKSNGRTLTWHSIRHSTGMYVYEQKSDLGFVAEILRHTSLESARKYAHPTPESQKDVIEAMQGGIQ
jgi:integrase